MNVKKSFWFIILFYYGTFIVKLQVRSKVNLKIPIQTLKGKDLDWLYNQTDHPTPPPPENFSNVET